MGVTVAYRGWIEDVDRVVELQDRVLDWASQVGAAARVWRTVSESDSSRVVRGLIVDLAPGQESTSPLFSPEGWLIGLGDIEDAEEGRLTAPPWCFVKTQYGPVEGHVALVELLDSLKKQWTPNLEVMDEGGYWEHRNVHALARVFARLQAVIDGLAEGLRRHQLSSEAAEDPQIVVARVERVAQQVRQTLSSPPEHPPAAFTDQESDDDRQDGSEAV